MEVLIPIIAVGGFFASVITFIYMFYKSRHQQRMALIDSGQSADIFAENKLSDKANALKTGMSLTGAAVGFLVGSFIEEYTRMDNGTAIIPFALIGGGIGLILFYNVISKKEDEQSGIN